ncbi:hypothetical protein GXW78_26810 [Roseomonas terrae]|uniref:Uncharacterized protein n=1 Tax=Neoroseomonas terrae TaxID=424799 RepID=A0ABS5EQJ0_9PROT|nr:hypothetical protein [Neoroseomonas terrae]MBR0653293.1 hypothetical protein [Neoroseomonas terrae]
MKGPSPWQCIGLAAVCREPISAIAAVTTAVAAIGGTVMQVAGSQQQAAAMRGQARQAEFDAESERIRGQVQSNQLRESLLRTLSAQRSRYAASGLIADEGSGLTLQEETAALADRELTMQTGNTTIRREQRRGQASLLNDSADWTETAGYARAGINLFEQVGSYAGRQAGTAKGPG